MAFWKRHFTTLLIVGVFLMVPFSTIPQHHQLVLEDFEETHSTNNQPQFSEFAFFDDWSSAPVYVPYDGLSVSYVANQTVTAFFSGDETAPDGSGQDMNRFSFLRSNETDFSWYSEGYTRHGDYSGTNSQGRVSFHPVGDGNLLVISAICNGDGTIQENQNSPTFNDPACEMEDGTESEGPIIRMFSFSVQENNTQDLGSITYHDCGRRPTSGGGSGGWNYRYFTPQVSNLAIHGNESNFSIMLGHRHNHYNSQSTGPGWPSADSSRCKIKFNGTEIDTLPSSSLYALDHITISNSSGTSTRISSGLNHVVHTSFTTSGKGIWSGQVSNGPAAHLRCEDFTNGVSTSLTNFSISTTYPQSGVAYLPGKLTENSVDKLALVDAVNCTVIDSYQSYVHLESNVWTDEDGFTRIIAGNTGNSAIMQFNRTVNRGVTFEVTISPNGSFMSFNATSVSGNSAHYPWMNQGYESWIGGQGSVWARDVDGDGFIDVKDLFPTDAAEWADTDYDGFGDNSDACPTSYGNSSIDRYGCSDLDGDGMSDLTDAFVLDTTQTTDSDNDGYGDNLTGFRGDACPNTYGESNRNGTYGCIDYDFDGWADSEDVFPYDSSQWSDWDGDGFGDELIGYEGDACPSQYGNSTHDRYGCLDNDGDGWSNAGDDFIHNPTQYFDTDGDGYGDNQSAGANMSDAFPNDGTQWNDTDGDGHGDNPYGTEGDWFPTDPTRWQDTDRDGVADEDDAFPNEASQVNDSDGDGFGDNPNGSRSDAFPDDPLEWIDSDGDGYGNNQDAFPNDGTQWNDTDGDDHGDNPYGTQGDWFPNDPNRWQDSDRDGVADEDDAFPNEQSQTTDLDGDGYGDNSEGNNPDAFPNDAMEWIDTDGDQVGNNADAFPFDPSQTIDADGDGFGDNPLGTGADKFPLDSTQWSDIDGDGYGDNPLGSSPDAFITDPTQWADTDGDGYGDNPTGRLSDAFIEDPTQWIDEDDDGFGDNQSGNNPDPFLFDFDNDGYNDSIDPLPKFASPGDLDNDGVLDEEDMFLEDFREWADNDGDGVGDNADTDDDNDGWSDADEVRADTDPFSSSEQPVDSFEIVIPGTAVGLGAWDLIGIFGGVPLFAWIGFGFITRNGRTAKYEEKLRAANTRDELEGIARQWEYSLMLRMLGPHQGIRLERLRAELDDVFERQNQTLSLLEPDEYDQTTLVQEEMMQEDKQTPEINLKPGLDAVGNPDEKGYEWITSEDGKNWYRAQGSKDDWVEFSN